MTEIFMDTFTYLLCWALKPIMRIMHHTVFYQAINFNSDIGAWDTSTVIDMTASE